MLKSIPESIIASATIVMMLWIREAPMQDLGPNPNVNGGGGCGDDGDGDGDDDRYRSHLKIAASGPNALVSRAAKGR